ncbi:MAG: DUF2147 domain-containing protein [Verrucomicrobia bacterium]|nr:DUF2147 domain-containing protein [Verrucomicrobiota bacterium]
MAQIFITALLFISFLNASAEGVPSPEGLWKNEDATFEILEKNGTLVGSVISINEPKASAEQIETDIHNPDASKRNRPLIGLLFMTGFVKKTDTRWENGTIYDPKTGNTYRCNLEMEGADRIKVRGYIGIAAIGRTAIWTRVSK